MKAGVFVTLKRQVLDPQGKTIQHALHELGFTAVTDVRYGKYIEVELSTGRKPPSSWTPSAAASSPTR